MENEIGFFYGGSEELLMSYLVFEVRFEREFVPLLLKLRDTSTFKILVEQVDDNYLTVQEAITVLLQWLKNKIPVEFLDRSVGFLENLFYCQVKEEISDSHFYPEGFPEKRKKKRKIKN